MRSALLISLHFLLLLFSCFLYSGFSSFYALFTAIYENNFLHLLHSSLFGHIILCLGFSTTNSLFGTLSNSEFSAYNEKACSVLADILMLSGIVSQEISIRSTISFCLLYSFISFSWTLNIKAQKAATKKTIFGTALVLVMAVVVNYNNIFSHSLLSILLSMEYLMQILNILKNLLFMVMDLQKVENNRTLYAFIITIGYLVCKSIVFALFIYQVSQKTRFPYASLKSLLTVLNKLYKKTQLFKKYLKLMRDLNSIEEVQVDSTCAICTEDIDKGKKLVCSHVFHAACLKMWCEREVSCPICRAELVFKREEIHESADEILTGIPIEVEDE